ncbi:MAG: ABC transporter ATP-binding protein [Myxococcota bacterium]|nr:ABC transporter ATP-binding protein [Myxococcota bacterium]
MSRLALEGVSFSRGARAVLRGVDLRVEPGEVLVLAGRNGVGKTTLVRLATRLIPPSEGRILLDGRPLPQLRRREIARAIAVVPQETRIPFPFSVTEVALMGRAPHLGPLGFESRADAERAARALEQVGIAELADRSVLDLSGGEQQLAVIARAICQDAPILLLDEPTAHLDVGRRIAVLDRVRALAEEGRAVLVVSHDLGLTARYADRVALLADGRVAAQGSPDEVLRPEPLRQAFGVEAEILRTSEGAPVVVPLGRGVANSQGPSPE